MKNQVDILEYINNKTDFKLNEKGSARIKLLTKEFDSDLLIQAIDTSFVNYIRYDSDGEVTKDSFETFIDKIGGVAHNISLNVVEKAIRYVLNIASSKNLLYYNQRRFKNELDKYIGVLRSCGYSDIDISDDLKSEVGSVIYECNSMNQVTNILSDWSDQLKEQYNKDNSEINSDESILSNDIFKSSNKHIILLCKQINASYESNLFDCTAVMMRRLVEILLIKCFINNGMERQIKSKNDCYLMLKDLILQLKSSQISGVTGALINNLNYIKEIGNLSAHSLSFNCTKKDIDDIKFKYRVTIEELLTLAE